MDFQSQDEYKRYKAAGDKLVTRLTERSKALKQRPFDRPIQYFVYSRVEDGLHRTPVGIGMVLSRPDDVDLVMACTDADGTVDGVPVMLSFDVTIKADQIKDKDIVKEMMIADTGAWRAGILSSPYEPYY